MEKESVIIGVGLFFLFMSPILYIIFKQSAKDRNRLKQLKKICSEHNMEPTHFEVSNTLLLGLDEKAKKMVVLEPQNEMNYEVIDLAELERSQVSKKTFAEPHSKKGRDRVIHVSLELVRNHGSSKVKDIVFYDEDDNDSLDPEARLFVAQKWDRMIRASLA